jgi:hypothetical protein
LARCSATETPTIPAPSTIASVRAMKNSCEKRRIGSDYGKSTRNSQHIGAPGAKTILNLRYEFAPLRPPC